MIRKSRHPSCPTSRNLQGQTQNLFGICTSLRAQGVELTSGHVKVVWGVIWHGSKDWQKKVEHQVKFNWNEHDQNVWIVLKEQKQSVELLRLKWDSLVIQKDRSRWFRLEECKDDAYLVKNCVLMEADGTCGDNVLTRLGVNEDIKSSGMFLV